MKISEGLALFLKNSEIATAEKRDKGFFLLDTDFSSFESGQLVIPMIKQLSIQTPDLASSLDLLKNVKGNSAKLYNWKVIIKALQTLGVEIDPDSKAHILSGDRDMIIDLLENIYKHYKKSSTPTRLKGKKPKLAPDGALYIDSLDSKRDLAKTESCLEFLLVSFCQSFDLQPKQAAGLLTQGNKFLAHVIVKGLKGDHSKIHNWYLNLYKNSFHLSGLIEVELAKGSLNMIFSSIKPGFLSKNIKTAEKCSEIVQKLFEQLIMYEDQLWDLLIKDGLDVIMLCLSRLGEDIHMHISMIFSTFKNEKLFDLVTEKIKNLYENPYEFLRILNLLYPGLAYQRHMFKESGVLDYYLNYCLSNIESSKIVDNKQKTSLNISKFSTLVRLWVDFYEDVDQYSSEILAESKRTLKDSSFIGKYSIVGKYFYLLETFYLQKKPAVGVLLKTLIFLLIENYEGDQTKPFEGNKTVDRSEFREFILVNFIQIFDVIETLPLHTVMEPLLKQIEYIKNMRFNVFDYDFFLATCRHKRMSVDNAVFLLDFLCRAYLEDVFFSHAALVPILYLVGTFFPKQPVAEYIYRFSELSLSMVCTLEITKIQQMEHSTKKASQILAPHLNPPEIETSVNTVHRRNLVLDITGKFIKLNHNDLTKKLTKFLLENNSKIKEISGTNYKAFEVLLTLIGDPSELVKNFESKAVVVYQPVQDFEQQTPLYKPPAITGRAADDIEKIKNIRALAMQKKLKSEEILKKKQQKVIQDATKDLEKARNLSVGIFDITEDLLKSGPIFEYFDIKTMLKNESELLEKMLKRYSLPIKLLFLRYNKPIIQKPGQVLPDQDDSIITEAQVINFCKGEGIFPDLIKRENVIKIIRETYKKESEGKNDGVVFNKKTFTSLLFQIAANCYNEGVIYNSSPLALRLWALLEHLKAREKNPKIYEDFDPGTTDRELAGYLTGKLAENPSFSLPPGVGKTIDYDFKVVFKAPKALDAPKSWRKSLEILDSVFFNALQVHLLRPEIVVVPKTVARGLPLTPTSIVLPVYLSVCPEIKACILHLTNKHTLDTLVECGKTLEDLLQKATNAKPVNLNNSFLSINKLKNNFLKQKEMENLEKQAKKDKSEAKRMKHKLEVQERLKQHQDEKMTKEQEEQKLREQLKIQEDKRMMEAEDKKKKKVEDKKKMIEMWKERKAEEEKMKFIELQKEKEKNKKSASQAILPALKRIKEDLKKLSSKQMKKNEKSSTIEMPSLKSVDRYK